MDITQIQSALQSLREEHVHIKTYIQKCGCKKELYKEQNASFNV